VTGIGGAERLVVDAAVALQDKGHMVEFYTAHHDENHCFSETKTRLKVHVYGDWLPRSIFGRLYAVFAYLRMIYTSIIMVLWAEPCHVIFCDQVSACIPILRLSKAKILFYCHFPDLLLSHRGSFLKRLYRYPLDKLEEVTTGLADLVLVNSEFTKGVYSETFGSLRAKPPPEVLYPCVTIFPKEKLAGETLDPSLKELPDGSFVSINRFERKKNVALALEGYIQLMKICGKDSKVPRLVFAGGFDPNNLENKEYLDELAERVTGTGLKYCLIIPDKLKNLIDPAVMANAGPQKDANVWFVPSFTDQQRNTLLSKSLAVLYTPVNEHFGIVPIEAMGACRPVITCNSGGPLESVIHKKTGYHCEPKPEDWAEAMRDVFELDAKAMAKMREDAYTRAKTFGIDAFGKNLDEMARGILRPIEYNKDD